MGVPVWPDCDIFKGLGDNVLVIIAQIFVNFLGYIEKCHLLSKTAVTTFLGKKWATFIFQNLVTLLAVMYESINILIDQSSRYDLLKYIHKANKNVILPSSKILGTSFG